MLSHMRQVLKELFGKIQDRGQGVPRLHRADFRASSGRGICPLDVALTTWAKKGDGAPEEDWKLASLFYVAIGTAVHSVVQNYLGYKRLLWGSWECPHCGKIWANQLGPGILCCGEMPEYVEYSLVHPDKSIGEYGHCDGIVPLGIKDYVVIEFKTISLAGKEDRSKYGPYDEHAEQASVYAEMFNKGYCSVIQRLPPAPGQRHGAVKWKKAAVLPPGKCVGILVVYIARDNPDPKNWVFLPRKITPGVLAHVEKVVPQARAAIKKGQTPEGTCKVRADALDEFGTWCPWVDTCFSRSRDKIIESIKNG